MRQAVLLLAHGGPERLEDIEDYLLQIRGGRPSPPALIREITRRYTQIGGASPLLARTKEQAEELERQLASMGCPVAVYIGMRNWHPFIHETMAQIHADGVERITAICLVPQYSRMSVGLYFQKTQEAKQSLGLETEIVYTKSFYAHRLLIEAFHEKLAPLLPKSKVLFTAHSLPEKIFEEGDPYIRETKATASAVAKRAGLTDWDFGYQSQGMTEDKWLGPRVEGWIDKYAESGVRELVVAPVGFVSDHVEILYDVDVHFREYARERNIELFRPESLNNSPTFIAALAEIAAEQLKTA